MQRTGRFRSSGAKGAIGAWLLVLALTTCPACADDYADGLLAFDAQDYQAAATSWRKAAQDGSADANMALGLLADLGLGMPREPETAFDYYQKAATQGVPAAAFNVGVMLDSGNGAPRDSTAAGIWYARAALSGNIRAAYNLGLMYSDGSGVPKNHDLAAYWLDIAATSLPAATETMQRLDKDNVREMVSPVALSGDGFAREGSTFADLVWTATPGPETSSFAVQIVSAVSDRPGVPRFRMLETGGSALQVMVPDTGFLWRVSRIAAEVDDYAASPWQRQSIASELPDPTGLVTIIVLKGDRRAAAVAANLTRALQDSGLVIQTTALSEVAGGSSIRYRYAKDRGLARDLAAFLPGFGPQSVVVSNDLATGPGEVVVTLVPDQNMAFTP